MKVFSKRLLYLFIIGSLHRTLYPELLIIKKENDEFVPISATSPESNEISKILLKYQWPMSTMSELTQQEKNELFSEKPYAEELFIEKKLKEINPHLSVVFIPTALWELFVIGTFLQDYKDNIQSPLQRSVHTLLKAHKTVESIMKHPWKIDLTDIINSNEPPARIRDRINAVYENANALFYDDNAWSEINEKLAFAAFSKFPELKIAHNGLSISDGIKKWSPMWMTDLITELNALHMKHRKIFREYDERARSNTECVFDLIHGLTQESESHIIAKIITLEYEARERNKAILIRGTSFMDFQMGKSRITLAGSTLLNSEQYIDMKTSKSVERSLEQAYAAKANKPYSVSFGNSLFAGALYDCGASAYTFLNYASELESIFKTVGYALSIDKKDYVEHHNGQLFFIAPLSSIASLFQEGEYFHSRTTVAVPSLTAKKTGIQPHGLNAWLYDSAGIIVITRDPLKHAALFSQFLANNGHIIQLGDGKDLTVEENQFVKDVKKAQVDAAQYYKAVQVLTPGIQKMVESWRNKK